MNNQFANNITPGDVFHPGEYIKDELEVRGMTQQNLANKMKMSKAEISLLINGKRNITPAISLKLEEVFGIDAVFWMNLQVNYEINTLKIRHKKSLKKAKIPKEDKIKLSKSI